MFRMSSGRRASIMLLTWLQSHLQSDLSAQHFNGKREKSGRALERGYGCIPSLNSLHTTWYIDQIDHGTGDDGLLIFHILLTPRLFASFHGVDVVRYLGSWVSHACGILINHVICMWFTFEDPYQFGIDSLLDIAALFLHAICNSLHMTLTMPHPQIIWKYARHYGLCLGIYLLSHTLGHSNCDHIITTHQNKSNTINRGASYPVYPWFYPAAKYVNIAQSMLS